MCICFFLGFVLTKLFFIYFHPPPHPSLPITEHILS